MSSLESLFGLEAEVGELLQEHRGTERDFSKYRNDPVGFIRDVLGGDPYEKQVEIASAVLEHPFVGVAGCNGSGKDWMGAQLALWWVYAVGGLCIITGPTQRQVQEIVFREIARAFVPGLRGELFSMALRLGRDEQRGIIGIVSNNVSRLTGFHAPRILTIITEAQGVDSMGWEGMLSCRTGDEDRTLALANPLEPSGEFFNKSKSPHWHFIRMPAGQHPNVRTGRTVIAGGPTRAWCQTIEREYGKGSATYQARVLAQFPDQGEESLFRRSWLEIAANAHRSRAFIQQAANAAPVLAVDPARYGPDSTAVAVRRGPVLQRIKTWRGADTTETTDRVIQEAASEGMRPLGMRGGAYGQIVVDTVGLGGGVCDQLKAKGWLVEEYSGGAFTASADRDRFLNTRAVSHWHLRKLLEEGRIALPPDELLFDELLAINWKPTESDRIMIEAKAALKARLGRSPDRADAVVMAFHSFQRTAGNVSVTTYAI